jgi:hypothetical protein
MAAPIEDTRAKTARTPRTEETAAGCEKVAPFVTTAEKQAICDWVVLEKIRRIA